MPTHTLCETGIETSLYARVGAILRLQDDTMIAAVMQIMRDEVFMSTLDELEEWLLRIGVEQAYAIVQGRVNRPFLAVETRLGVKRILGTDSGFATAPATPARYATTKEALRAGERARNRRAGGAVIVETHPYLPVA